MSSSKVKVVCRFRPQNKIEVNRGGHLAVKISHDSEILLQSDKVGVVNRMRFFQSYSFLQKREGNRKRVGSHTEKTFHSLFENRVHAAADFLHQRLPTKCPRMPANISLMPKMSVLFASFPGPNEVHLRPCVRAVRNRW